MLSYEPISATTLLDRKAARLPRNLRCGIKSFDALIEPLTHDSDKICITAALLEDAISISNAIIASHLSTASTAVTIIDCTNSFDLRALRRAIKADGNEIARQLERTNIVRAFDLDGVRDSIDEIKACIRDREDHVSSQREPASNTTDTTHLLVIDRLSYLATIALKSSIVQGRAALDSFLQYLSMLSEDHGIITLFLECFIQSKDGQDMDCAFEMAGQASFLTHDIAPSLDLHLHAHRASKQDSDIVILEIAQDSHGQGGHWAYCNVSFMIA